MKYRDLIRFQPIENLLRIDDTADPQTAAALADTFAVSLETRAAIAERILPQLHLEPPGRGILLMGSYGTGKTHLMSLIAGVAEGTLPPEALRDQQCARAAAAIEGRYKVVRAAVEPSIQPLRELLLAEIQGYLLQEDAIDDEHPELPVSPDSFDRIMEKFNSRFPDHALLLLVDGLTDYLKARSESALASDIEFLSELSRMGEKNAFRIMAGLREIGHDRGGREGRGEDTVSAEWPQFQEQVFGLQDHFETLRLTERDLDGIVANRLLGITAENLERIRAHLEPFIPCYSNLENDPDTFAHLFPFHPETVEMLAQISMLGREPVLRMLSDILSPYLDRDLPEDEPGIITCDACWLFIKANPAFSAIPDVKSVIDCNQLIESRIQRSFTPVEHRELAVRIIRALSMHRLTTGGIHIRKGISPKALRDLILPSPALIRNRQGDPAEQLLQRVDSVLGELMKTLDGQFLSRHSLSNQYFIDLKKTENFDANIEKRTKDLTPPLLDRYYYEVLKRTMECTYDTYVSGYRIWYHDLQWYERNASRKGYLIFGSPDEGTSRIPRLDFKIYFIQPFVPPEFDDSPGAGEVFLRISRGSAYFWNLLKSYAAAMELASETGDHAEFIYEIKASGFLKKLLRWLDDNLSPAFELIYRGRSASLLRWAEGHNIRELSRISPNERINFKNFVNTVCGIVLSRHFSDQAPAYPFFPIPIPAADRGRVAQEALWGIAGGRFSPESRTVMEGLELMNDRGQVEPMRSRYGRFMLRTVDEQGDEGRLYRSKLIIDIGGAVYMAPEDVRLEAEWAIVLLAAFIYSGDLVLVLSRGRFDAGRLSDLAARPLPELMNFEFVEHSREWNPALVRDIFDLLKLPAHLSQLVFQGKREPIEKLRIRLEKLFEEIEGAQEILSSQISFWGAVLIHENQIGIFRGQLDDLTDFARRLMGYVLAENLKDFSCKASEFEECKKGMEVLIELLSLQEFVRDMGELTSFLTAAGAAFLEKDEWVRQMRGVKSELLTRISRFGEHRTPQFRNGTFQRLRQLKGSYIDAYLYLHGMARLSGDEEKQRQELLRSDPRLQKLRQLAKIPLMPANGLSELIARLEELITCTQLTEGDLRHYPLCPHCFFKPAAEPLSITAGKKLERLNAEIDRLTQTWTKTLQTHFSAFSDGEVSLMLPRSVTRFAEDMQEKGELPDDISDDFIREMIDLFAAYPKQELPMERIKAALEAEGNPASPADLKRLFSALLDEMSGEDGDRVRIEIA